MKTENKKHDTRAEMEREVAVCRSLFEKKTRDYGTSWRVMRLPSLTDQIYIKASRIRSIEESGENHVGDGVGGEFVAMVNYGIMALIQAELKADEPLELPLERTMELYDKHMKATLDLMMAKNHISLNELAEKVGITNVNLSKIKNNKANAIRFSTLSGICEALNCEPGDILKYDPDGED